MTVTPRSPLRWSDKFGLEKWLINVDQIRWDLTGKPHEFVDGYFEKPVGVTLGACLADLLQRAASAHKHRTTRWVT